VQPGGGGIISGERQMGEFDQFARQQIGGNADDPLGAHRHEGQGQRVVAAEHHQIAAQGELQLVDAIDRAAGFLDVGNVRILGPQAFHHRHADLDATTARNGIKNDRPVRGLRDPAKWW